MAINFQNMQWGKEITLINSRKKNLSKYYSPCFPYKYYFTCIAENGNNMTILTISVFQHV